jgi:dihydroorotate dehydrogenase electron transfer subunit
MRHTPRIVRIQNKKNVTKDIVTFTVRDPECATAKPGQFAMIWIPGVDEIPMSIFPVDRDVVLFAIKKVGEATKALNDRPIGGKIGLRGPYGTFFAAKKKSSPLLVAGGTGVVPLALLMKDLSKANIKATFVVGAKTRKDHFFLDRIRSVSHYGSKLVVATDDGTRGVRGLASEIATDLCRDNSYDEIFSCGPEQMILSLFDLCERKKIHLQASLERIMKCGVGICGSCCIGKYRVCVDGPVLHHAQLREVAHELGRWTRDHSGKLMPL